MLQLLVECKVEFVVQDGEYTDSNGVYHRVLKGVIETQEDEDCAGIIELSESHLQLTGSGGLASAKVLFRSSPR